MYCTVDTYITLKKLRIFYTRLKSITGKTNVKIDNGLKIDVINQCVSTDIIDIYCFDVGGGLRHYDQ